MSLLINAVSIWPMARIMLCECGVNVLLHQFPLAVNLLLDGDQLLPHTFLGLVCRLQFILRRFELFDDNADLLVGGAKIV